MVLIRPLEYYFIKPTVLKSLIVGRRIKTSEKLLVSASRQENHFKICSQLLRHNERTPLIFSKDFQIGLIEISAKTIYWNSKDAPQWEQTEGCVILANHIWKKTYYVLFYAQISYKDSVLSFTWEIFTGAFIFSFTAFASLELRF